MQTQNSIVTELESAVARTQQVGAAGKILEVLQYPDPRLREVSKPVILDVLDPTFQQFLNDLAATMEALRGLGLAAIQVGVASRALVVRDADGSVVKVINPVVTESDGEVTMPEGCLSFPGLYLNIKRPKDVTVEYINEKGERKTAMADGLLARAIVHEIDHLDGKVFTDLVPKILRSGILKKYETKKQKYEAYREGLSAPKSTGPKYAKKTKAERQKEKKKRYGGKR